LDVAEVVGLCSVAGERERLRENERERMRKNEREKGERTRERE